MGGMIYEILIMSFVFCLLLLLFLVFITEEMRLFDENPTTLRAPHLGPFHFTP